MVGMKAYSHLTLSEREFIYAQTERGESSRVIAQRLGRDHSTVLRELKRNAVVPSDTQTPIYSPALAEQRSRQRRGDRMKKLDDPSLRTFVVQKLTQGWSPEQIAGRLKLRAPTITLSHETIYQFVYAPAQRSRRLWEFLRRGRTRRQAWNGRHARTSKQAPIPNRISIEWRPAAANQRRQVGHWESDLLQGVQRNTAVVAVSVDRCSRYVVMDKLSNKTPRQHAQSLITTFQRGALPVYSLTFDNGVENRDHAQVARSLRCQTFFCHAYHAWEKGTVENTIGLIRSYIPKRTDLNTVTLTDLRTIARELNDRPRKRLGFYTPSEVMYKETGWCT